jgi:hypothetical protein
MISFGQAHVRRILSAYAAYYNQARTHLALQKDAPLHRAVQRSGTIVAIPILARLHHQYGPDMIFGKDNVNFEKVGDALAKLASHSPKSIATDSLQPEPGGNRYEYVG